MLLKRPPLDCCALGAQMHGQLPGMKQTARRSRSKRPAETEQQRVNREKKHTARTKHLSAFVGLHTPRAWLSVNRLSTTWKRFHRGFSLQPRLERRDTQPRARPVTFTKLYVMLDRKQTSLRKLLATITEIANVRPVHGKLPYRGERKTAPNSRAERAELGWNLTACRPENVVQRRVNNPCHSMRAPPLSPFSSLDSFCPKLTPCQAMHVRPATP